jgi:hypothetical protein
VAPIIIPIGAFAALAFWLAMVFYASSHPTRGGGAEAGQYRNSLPEAEDADEVREAVFGSYTPEPPGLYVPRQAASGPAVPRQARRLAAEPQGTGQQPAPEVGAAAASAHGQEQA